MPCTRDVGVDTRPGARQRFRVHGQRDIGDHGAQVVLRQIARARHQLDVRAPEGIFAGRRFGNLRGLPREIAAGDRPLAEDVAQPVAVAVAQAHDFLVRGAAVRAGVAAVLDQRELRVVGSEDVVAPPQHLTVEAVLRGVVHPRITS